MRTMSSRDRSILTVAKIHHEPRLKSSLLIMLKHASAWLFVSYDYASWTVYAGYRCVTRVPR